MHGLRQDTLFLAATRPAVALGIPLPALVIVACGSLEVLWWTHRPIPAGVIALIAYAVCRVLTAWDHNIFRLLYLWYVTKLRGLPNARHWGGSSGSPATLRPPRQSKLARRLGLPARDTSRISVHV